MPVPYLLPLASFHKSQFKLMLLFIQIYPMITMSLELGHLEVSIFLPYYLYPKVGLVLEPMSIWIKYITQLYSQSVSSGPSAPLFEKAWEKSLWD